VGSHLYASEPQCENAQDSRPRKSAEVATQPKLGAALLDASRVFRALGCFTELVVRYKVANVRQWLNPAQEAEIRQATHEKGAASVLELCRANGGMFIKFGQHAISLKGAIPPTYIETLSVLQDRAPQRHFAQVCRVLKEELGEQHYLEIIDSIDPSPIGCASLAQVHRATLPDGTALALKVQHEDLGHVIASDVKLIRLLNSAANRLFEDFSLGWAVDAFEENLVQELDFETEARNCEQTRKSFSRDARLKDKVVVPQVYNSYSSGRVLSMDFIEGVPIHDTRRLSDLGVDVRQVGKTVMEAFAAMVFTYGFVHADPHPGNLSVVVGEKGSTPKVALLDHGLYRKLDENFRENNCLLWKSMILQDETGVRTACEGMGKQTGLLWDLLPFLLVNRTLDSKVALGDHPQLTPEQATALKKRLGITKLSMQDIGALADKLPSDMIFVLKVWHLIKDLNDKLEGTNRDRFLIYANYAVTGKNGGASMFPVNTLKWWAFLSQLKLNELWTQSFSEIVGLAPSARKSKAPQLTLSTIAGERYAN